MDCLILKQLKHGGEDKGSLLAMCIAVLLAFPPLVKAQTITAVTAIPPPNNVQ
jgi:hypothetical protein